MNQDGEGETMAADEHLKDLLSKSNTPSYIRVAAICRKNVIVKKTPRETTKTSREAHGCRLCISVCLNSAFVKGICVYLVALKAQSQTGVNTQGKYLSSLLP